MTKFKRKSRAEREMEIRQAATKVFLDKGYRNATMEDVIAETTLSKGGVYKYYGSTREMLMDIMRQGNSMRLLKIKELEEAIAGDQPFSDVMVLLALNKIFDPAPEKRLYIMFLLEMIYDSRMADLFYQLEQESKDQLLAIVSKRQPAIEQWLQEGDYELMGRVISLLILGDQLLNQEDVFKGNQHKVAAMLKGLCQTMMPAQKETD